MQSYWTKLSAQRIGRRRALATTGGAALGAALLAACGSGKSSSGGATSASDESKTEEPKIVAETNPQTPLNTSTGNASTLPDYAPVPQAALGPALNGQGYYVGRVERNLYWVTDGTYQAAFLTTNDGVVLFDAPPTI